MLTVLDSILHGILDIPYLVVSLLVEAVNGWIMILGLALSAAIAVLPGFPEVPALAGEIRSGVAWFLPIGAMLAVFATFVTAWLLWMAVSVILRWARAL